MGICLDTERNSKNGSQEFEMHGRDAWLTDENDFEKVDSPSNVNFPQTDGHVKFEVPGVPVIFVLGGPGSGKVTHCDSLTQEKRGVVHINMTDLLQQYSVGDSAGTSDFSRLMSRTVTEVLMLEMKMAPAAKTYLVSGYPRNMRDLVEYSNKIQTISGVILVSWRQRVLERQIEYGAKLGHVVLGLARMELANFYKNVIPVIDYFDQKKMLTMINGERNPTEVYADFRSAVLKIIGKQSTTQTGSMKTAGEGASDRPIKTSISVYNSPTKETKQKTSNRIPPVIWIVGGPGSNKFTLCQKAIRKAHGWIHISVGQLLRSLLETTNASQVPDNQLKNIIARGDLAPSEQVMHLVEREIKNNSFAKGIVLDGFPRDLKQLEQFQIKFKQKPTLILLDCSKLQLARGRLDDTVAAFRKRLELFREHTLPLLKHLDDDHRMNIVDGDTDLSEVQDIFSEILLKRINEIQSQGERGGAASPVARGGRTQTVVDVHGDAFGEPISPPRSPPKFQMNGYGPPREARTGRDGPGLAKQTSLFPDSR
ncbi:adenylate kinase isoenzyme 5 [Bemisia tabaci]